MKITRNSIILTNRESRDAGHHVAKDPEMAEARREYAREAHKLARFNDCHVEVFATQRGAQPWVVYACGHERCEF